MAAGGVGGGRGESDMLKRSTPMKRAPFCRADGPTAERERRPMAKAPPVPKCKHCKRRLGERERGIHAECVEGWYAANREKLARAAERKKEREARAERERIRERKEKLKTVSDWEDECRKIVQKIARIRDRNDGCISCHLPATWGGQWHGSHYRSHGACSSLQFHLWNIHKACSSCNHQKGGNIIEYRPRLIAKIGQERHDWLMAQPKAGWKHGPAYIEYLKRFKKVMGKRLRRMERRTEE